MSTAPRTAGRVVRRELHSPRSTAAIAVAVVLVLALVWVGTESVLAALRQPALLLDPSTIARDVRGLSGAPAGLLIVSGVLTAVVGLVLIVLAVTPGRRGRHAIDAEGSPAVVDDEVIASALSRTAATESGLAPERVVTSVGRRSATVTVTPVSGMGVDREALQRAVAEHASALAVQPPIRARVVLDARGRVGR